jgi:hypothetical protein
VRHRERRDQNEPEQGGNYQANEHAQPKAVATAETGRLLGARR